MMLLVYNNLGQNTTVLSLFGAIEAYGKGAIVGEDGELEHGAVWHEAARAVTIEKKPLPKRPGFIGVLCAGTSDLPVAEEAAVTAEVMGNVVERISDVGVVRDLMVHDIDLACAIAGGSPLRKTIASTGHSTMTGARKSS